MKTVTNPTEKRLRVTSNNGMFVTYIDSGETRNLPDALFVNACTLGCIPAGGSAALDNPATEDDESKIAKLVEAMQSVLDEGDADQMTASGCPKASILKKLVGDHTADEREQAWQRVNGDD